jgi:transcriptional regulator with XRE-family HTH domain
VDSAERFARNLRARRLEAQLSQEALGHRANLHPTEISRLERGVRDPRLSTMSRPEPVKPGETLSGGF